MRPKERRAQALQAIAGQRTAAAWRRAESEGIRWSIVGSGIRTWNLEF